MSSVGATVRLSSATGCLLVAATSLAGSKHRRLIPVMDHNGRWVALLRFELLTEGCRLRTELLDTDRRPQPGGWIQADAAATVELSWEFGAEGECHYLAMTAA